MDLVFTNCDETGPLIENIRNYLFPKAELVAC